MKWRFFLLLLSLSPWLTSCVIVTGNDQAMSRESKSIVRVARKLMFKKIRAEFKSQLEDEFRANPSMGPDEFERCGDLIHNLGRRMHRDYEAERLREEVLEGEKFNRAKDGRKNRVLAEKEVDLLQWGPFVVDDEGLVKFNPLILFKRKKITDFWVHTVDEREDRAGLKEPVIFRKNYKVNVRLRVNFNLLRAVRDQRVDVLITKYRLLFETKHYAAGHTRRKLFTNEYELSYNSEDGQVAFFWNFIVPF